MINTLIGIVIDRLGGRRIERLTDGVIAPTQAPFFKPGAQALYTAPTHKPSTGDNAGDNGRWVW